MRHEDITACAEFFPQVTAHVADVRRVVVLSPHPDQVALMRSLFPDATVETLDVDGWRLPRAAPARWDVVMLGNTMLHADNPDLWFTSLRSACRLLLVQDVCRGWRGGDRELGSPNSDGPDLRRYQLAREGWTCRSGEYAYDLDGLGDALVGARFYELEGANGGSVHVAFAVRGLLPDPEVSVPAGPGSGSRSARAGRG